MIAEVVDEMDDVKDVAAMLLVVRDDEHDKSRKAVRVSQRA